MAKFLDKDPFTYEREKKEFLHALRQYHASKGVQPAMFRMPKVSGRDLDLYLLYCKVVSLGGVVKVTNERNWDLVSEVLGFPPGCSQIGYVIRQHYIRYLESYEKVHFKGEDDDEARGKRPHTPISCAYRKEISDKVRQTHGFAKEKCKTSEYDRIIHSLQSGLPNEVDFAINICTLLSNEGKHVIHLEKAPMLIDLLLAHAGIFYEGPGSLRKLYEEDWMPKTKRKFVQFWYDTISDKEVREVIGPGSKKPEDKRQYKDVELFAVRKMGLSDVEGQRILQIAIIFRNLSFESHHVSKMASHRTLYRFLLLLAHNSCTMLQQLGMDTLTNICNHIVLDSIDYVSTQLMLHTIHKGLLSQSDKFVALRSMELMEKLLMVDNNLDLFQRCLEPTIYVKIITLLTIHDIQLLLGALEVMLVMSEREEPFCTRISSVHRSIDVLVCLVTLDAQSLGADAFVGIKIVDHVPDGIHHPIVTMGRPGMTPTQPPQPSPAQHHASQPQRPTPVASNSSASPTPPPPAHTNPVREGEMENLACQWLGAHYETDHLASITNIDLYADYLSACGKIMGRNILNSNDFMRCVKMVFPAVEGKKAETEAGPQFLIAGIKRRRVPLPWKFQPNQSAPSPSASAMIARMAQRHSPSPTVSPSPPPPKGGVFTPGIPQGVPPGIPPGIPQRQLIAPPAVPAPAPLPGQVHGQIPGHIHGPMVAGPAINGPTPGQILGQTGQLPVQSLVQGPANGQVAPGGVVVPRPMVPVMQQQPAVQQPMVQQQVLQAPGSAPSIGQVPQQGQPQRPDVLPQQPPQGGLPQQIPQGAQLQQPAPQSTRGENVSVADIIAGNMRVPQQQLNFGLQQQNGKQVNGQMAPGQALNGPQNFVGAPGVLRSNNPGAPGFTLTEQLMSKSIPQAISALPQQEQTEALPVHSGNGQHYIQSDTNSESSIELSSKSKSRSRSNSGKSGKKAPSRQSSKSPSRNSGGVVKSPKPSGDDASTEKCQPPLKVPLPDGEVRIEKIPNMHAVGVNEGDDESEDRTDLAEGIIRQIAGSPVLNQTSCDVPMESESMISEADTTEDEGSQTPKMNGGMSTPDLPPQRMQGLVTTVADCVANSQAGVFSQPPQQAKVAQQYINSQQGTAVMVSQSQPQQQYVIQQQIPVQAVASRGVVVQSHPVSISGGTVVRSTQGTVLQTQGGNFVQVQPQVVQGHQTVIHNQANFQGQQFQTTQMPLHVTLVQQPSGQGQVQQQVQPQQQQLNVVTGVQHLQSGQTMIMTNSNQATILSQNQGQVVMQNVGTPPRSGPKPILPQPSPVASSAQGPRPILPQPPLNQMAQIQGTQTFQIATPIQHHQVHTTSVAQVQANAQNVQIARFPGIQRLQGQLSPTNRDSPLIKRLLQQGPALQAGPGQQQVQVIQSPQQGQIVLNAIGQSQGTPMAVQTQGQAMPLSHVQVVSPFPQAMTVQSSPTLANIPQIQLHPQPILPAPGGITSPSMNTPKSKKKSKHKKKDKDRDKNKSITKEDPNAIKMDIPVATNGEKDMGNGYSINVISEDGDKKVVGIMCNGLPVETRTESNDCNNPADSLDTPTKQGLPNGFMNDKLHSGVKLGKEGIASKDIETILKKTPQTIGDKVDIEQMKRDNSSGENGIIADKLGKPCLNHVMNGDMGSRADSPLLKENYDSNKTVSDRLDKLYHGAVPNLSQSTIPNASTPNPKSLVAFCHDIRPSFPSTVPSVTVGAVANANNNNQQNSCPSVPVAVSRTGDKSAASIRTLSSQSNAEAAMQTSSTTLASSQAATSTPSTTSSQTSLPLPAQQPPSPLTVQVPSPSTASAHFKRPIDDVLSSPDPKQSSNPAPSPTTPVPTPPSPSPSTSRSSKKRRRHSSSSSTSSSSRKSSSGKTSAPPPVVPKYVCEWKGCSRKLVSGKALHTHTCLAHILTINYRGICEWEGCDRIQRQRWSVVSHIMDKHCSEQAVQASMDKRAQRAAQPTPPPSQDSSPQPPPIVYNAHTAYHAIRRSLNMPSLNEFLGENEGPVTKSIRLTAALILKNLATHSAVGRKEIRKHELLLARLAISNTESSTTLAKCLNKLELDS